MNYPILAAQNTWWKPNVSTVTRASITEIEIMDSYTPNSSETVVDSWDASAAEDGSITCYVIGTKLIIAGNGSGMIAANENSTYAFSYNSDWSDYFSSVVIFNNAELIDFSGTINANGLLYDCESLTSINVSTWDLSNCENIASLFNGCKKIDNIDVSNWDVSKVIFIYSLFAGCKALSSVDLSKWRFRQDKDLGFRQMFLECENLISVGDLSNWTINIISMENMFMDCYKLKELSLGNITVKYNEYLNHLAAVLWKCSSLTDFKIKNLQSELNNVSFSNLFADCSALKNIDLSGVDFSCVGDMSFMFYRCSSLGEIDVSNWVVSNVTNFDHFAAHANLKRKGIEKWNTSSAINMNAMFHNCAEEELDLSGFDTSKVQFFSQMFENSPNLKRIKGLENWDTSNGIGFDQMFGRCYALEELDLSSFDTSKAKNGVTASSNNHKTATLQNFINDCRNLKKVTFGPNFAINGDDTNTNAEYKLILPTPSTDYIEGADGSWYTFTGQNYTPNAIPDRTYNTYYASKNLIRDLPIRINNGTILDIVKAVREKIPNLEPTLLSDLDDIIKNI